MLRLLELDVHVLHVDGDVVDLEEVALIILVGSLESSLEAKATAAKEDIHDTLVCDGREALLLLDVVAHILQVHLDAGDSQHDLVLVLILDRLASPTEMVVAAELENVRRQVVTLNDQILNDSINHGIGILDARDGNVADILEEGWENDVAEVFDEVRLEFRLAVLVVTQVIEELIHCVGESAILRILVELVGEELCLVNDTIGVIAVTLAKKEVALVIKLVPLLVGVVLHYIALLFEATAKVGVNVFEPTAKLGVLISITVDLVYGVEPVVRRRAVGKALDEDLKVDQHGTERIREA